MAFALAGSGAAAAATSSPSSSAVTTDSVTTAATPAPTPTPTSSAGAPRSNDDEGGATGIIESTSASGFTLQTWTGLDVTVTTANTTKVQDGSRRALRTGKSVLVFGVVDISGSTSSIAAIEIVVQPHGDGGAAVGKRDGVLPIDPGEAAPTTSVGTIPADYTQGTGTIVSGWQAYAAFVNAQAVFPGGVVDRVVQLSEGNYEVHNEGIEWPHHVFETTQFRVEGAND